MIKIVPYQIVHQEGIDKMIREITIEYDLPALPQTYKPKLPDFYRVALLNEEVIGTIGVNDEKEYAVLKRMFVKNPFRGKEMGVSSVLLETAIHWCRKKSISKIYLGTLQQFKAAQKFYEKNGFRNILENELPADFQNNPLDKVFYQLNLNL